MPRRQETSVLVASILCVALLAGPVGAQTPEQPAAKEMGALEVGKPIEQSIKGGESHRYTIRLEAGQLIKGVVEQKGVDVAVALLGPDGKPVLEVDSPNGTNGPEPVLVVGEAAGPYTLEVKTLDPSDKGGRYDVQVEEVRTATETDRALAEATKAMGASALLSASDNLEEAIPLAERAIALFEKALGPDHPDMAARLHNMAELYYSQVRYAKAEPLFVRALAIYEKALGPEHPQVATSLNILAEIYINQRQHAKAEPLLVRALAIREKALGPEHPDVALSLNNLATVYYSQDQLVKAEPLFVRALAMREKALGPEHPDVALSLNNLAGLYLNQRQYAKAEPLYVRALAIYEKALGPEQPYVAGSLNNLATVYRVQGQYAKAEPLFVRALAIREKALGPEHHYVALSLNNLAGLYLNQRQYAKAEPLFVRALAIYEKAFGSSHRDTAFPSSNLAILRSATGRIPEAVQDQARTNQVRERDLSLNLVSGSERAKLRYLQLSAHEINRTLSLHTRLAPADPDALRMAVEIVLQRKGRALDAMTDSIQTLRRHASAQDQALLVELADARQRLARLTLAGPGRTGVEAHRTALGELERQVEQLEAQVSSRSAEFRAVLAPVTLDAVRAAIPADARLVEFAVYRLFDPKAHRGEEFGVPRYVAYVVSSAGEMSWADLGEAARIDSAVDALRQALADPQRRDARTLARALDDLVMRPVRRLTGSTRHLLIAPDGALNLIPLGALVDERGRYLVQTHELRYLTSGRDLLRLAAGSTPREKALVVADPTYGDQALAATAETREILVKKAEEGSASVDFGEVGFPPLASTEAEARALGALLPGSSVLTGEAATEAALKNAKAPRILHVATHGYFLPDLGGGEQQKIENPLLRSGLALAGANARKSGDDDGILTALEVAGLDLWGTKLVVLSACETGVGEVKTGDGVYGLRRALVLAGSESQVMSLWKVSDRETKNLMVAYYRGLLAGQGRTAALRQVQLRMLRRPTTRHPFYWASFIQSGAWGPLDGGR